METLMPSAITPAQHATWYVQSLMHAESHAVCVHMSLTGLTRDCQPVHIAVVDAVSGTVLLNQFICPTIDIDPNATTIHGLAANDLAESPLYVAVAEQVKVALNGAIICTYGGGMARSALANVIEIAKVDGIEPLDWVDIAPLYRNWLGNKRQVGLPDKTGRAIDDAQCVRDVMVRMSRV